MSCAAAKLSDLAVVLANPDDTVTAAAFSSWLDTVEKVLTDGSSGLPVGVVGPGVIGCGGWRGERSGLRRPPP